MYCMKTMGCPYSKAELKRLKWYSRADEEVREWVREYFRNRRARGSVLRSVLNAVKPK